MERSDLHDFLVLVSAGVVDQLDIFVGQLLGLFLQLLLVVLGKLAGLLHCLELVHGVAADVAHGSLGVLALLLTSLVSCLRRSSVGAGNTRRMVWPSSMGLMPISLVWIALEIALIRVPSQG